MVICWEGMAPCSLAEATLCKYLTPSRAREADASPTQAGAQLTPWLPWAAPMAFHSFIQQANVHPSPRP